MYPKQPNPNRHPLELSIQGGCGLGREIESLLFLRLFLYLVTHPPSEGHPRIAVVLSSS